MSITVNNEVYLNTKETTSRLGISRQTLYEYVTAGKLQQYKQGVKSLKYYKEAEVDALNAMLPVKPGDSTGA